MDDRDLEQRLAGYRPVVERAMARRPLSIDGGRDRRRWAVSAVAAATVAAGVVGWVALAGDEPTSTGNPGAVATTSEPQWGVPVDGGLLTDAQIEQLECYLSELAIPSTTMDERTTCYRLTFCAEGVDGTITIGSDAGVPIDGGTIDSSGELMMTQSCWFTWQAPTFVAFGDTVMFRAEDALEAAGIDVIAGENWDAGTMMQQVSGVVRLQTPNAVVLQVGHAGNLDPGALDAVMSSLAEVPRVVVLTLHGDRDWYSANNEILRALPAEHANVIVLDWDVLAAHCPGECLASDGYHLTQTGAEFYAELITNAVGAGGFRCVGCDGRTATNR